MKRYRCHKVVSAAPINDVFLEEDGSGMVSHNDEKGHLVETEVPAGFARPGKEPQRGDYIVRYDGDYLSWSPKAVFEAGYTEMGQYEKG